VSQEGIITDNSSPDPDIETITGNTGGAVGPDGSFNVNLLGDGSLVTVTGDPPTNTLTITVADSFATTYTADSGSATPSSNNLNVFGDATQGLSTSGSGATLTLTNADATTSQKGVLETSTDAESIAGTSTTVSVTPESLKAKLGTQTSNSLPYGAGTAAALSWTSALTDGQLVIGATGTAPAAANLTSSDASITITNGSNSIDLTTASSVALQFDTDSGSAVPSSGVIDILGGNGIATSGATNVVTIEMDSPFTGDFTFTDSTAGDTETLTVSNTDNTAANASSASLEVNVAGTTQIGDPYVSFGTGSSIAFSVGTDTSDSQNFKINTDTASSVTPSSGTNIFLLNSTSDCSVNTLSLGHAPPEIDTSFTINGAALSALLSIDTEGATDLGGVVEHRHSATAGFGAHYIGLRSRGTHDSETVVQDDDVLVRFLAGGYDGTDYSQAAEIRAEVDGTPGSNDMPGRWVFLTSLDGGQTPTEAMRISADQSVALSGAFIINLTSLDDTDSAYTVLSTDHYMSCDVSSGDLSIELPDAPTTGRVFTVKDATGSATSNTLSVTTDGGSVTIDGSTTFTFFADYQATSFLFNGTSYEAY
jgi:hypothetical protein